YPQRDAARKRAEVRRDAVVHRREYRNAQRRSGGDGQPLPQNDIDHQDELRWLLRAADRQDSAIVALQIILDLHPVHFLNSHETSSASEPYRRSPEKHRGWIPAWAATPDRSR